MSNVVYKKVKNNKILITKKRGTIVDLCSVSIKYLVVSVAELLNEV